MKGLQYFSWYLYENKECVTGMRNSLGKRTRSKCHFVKGWRLGKEDNDVRSTM